MIDYQLVRWYILLSDAEPLEYPLQDILGADFAEDGIERVDCGAKVLGEQIACGAGGKAGADTMQVVKRGAQGFVVAKVGDKGGIVVGNQDSAALGKAGAKLI